MKGHWSYRTIAWRMKEKVTERYPVLGAHAGDSARRAGCVDAVTGDQPVMHQHQHKIDTALLAGIGTASGMKRSGSERWRRLEKKIPCPYFALNVTHLLRGSLPMPGGSMPMRYRKLPTSTEVGTGLQRF